MAVRFASFNVENLFARPRPMNLETWADGRPILEAFAEFNSLIALGEYTPAIKARMIQLLLQLEVYRDDNGIVRRNRTTSPRWAWLRANRGTFDVERIDTGIEIVADNRSDWVGWVELATEPVDELTVEMTSRVIQDVAADILCVVEALFAMVREPPLSLRPHIVCSDREALPASRFAVACGQRGAPCAGFHSLISRVAP